VICGWVSDSKARCTQEATVYAMGVSYCAGHAPKGEPNCSHSLAPSGRCAWCGAPTGGSSSLRLVAETTDTPGIDEPGTLW